MSLPRFRRSTEAPRCLLQPRDIALLADLARYRLLTTSQLELLRGCDPDPELQFVSRLTLTRRLKLLFHGRHVQRIARPSTGGMQEPVYLLDKEGARMLNLHHGEANFRSPSQQPKLAALEHLLAINQFRVAVEVAAKGSGEAFELREWQDSANARFTVSLASESKRQAATRKVTLIPDGAFCLGISGVTHYYYLEVDRGSEASRILTEKCRAYYVFWADGGFAQKYRVEDWVGFRVLFVAPTPKRLNTIRSAISKLAYGHAMFCVALEGEITPDGVAQPIWRDALKEEQRVNLAAP